MILAILGVVVIGLGVIWLSLWVALVGLAVLVLGAAWAWAGGLGSDTRSGGEGESEGEEIKEADVHPGTSPAARVSDEEMQRRAAERTRRTDRILEAAHHHPRPPLAPLGVVLLLLVALWLAIGTSALYPDETRAGPLRDGSMAAVMALAALWAALMPEGKRIAAAVAFLLGLGLLLIGIFETSTTQVLHGQHVVTGILALIGALLCLLSPVREPPE